MSISCVNYGFRAVRGIVPRWYMAAWRSARIESKRLQKREIYGCGSKEDTGLGMEHSAWAALSRLIAPTSRNMAMAGLSNQGKSAMDLMFEASRSIEPQLVAGSV